MSFRRNTLRGRTISFRQYNQTYRPPYSANNYRAPFTFNNRYPSPTVEPTMPNTLSNPRPYSPQYNYTPPRPFTPHASQPRQFQSSNTHTYLHHIPEHYTHPTTNSIYPTQIHDNPLYYPSDNLHDLHLNMHINASFQPNPYDNYPQAFTHETMLSAQATMTPNLDILHSTLHNSYVEPLSSPDVTSLTYQDSYTDDTHYPAPGTPFH